MSKKNMELFLSIALAVIPILATAAIVFVSYSESGLKFLRPDKSGMVAFAIVMLGALLQITKEVSDWRRDIKAAELAKNAKVESAKRSATTGIISANQLFPKTRYSYNTEQPLTVRLGQSETYLHLDLANWMGAEGTEDETVPRPLFGAIDGSEEYQVYLWIKDGKPQLRIHLFNARNQLVAKVDGNRWSVKREYLWDVNYDDQAFEVRNERNEVQLQLIFYKDLIEISYFNYDYFSAYGLFTVDGKAVQSKWHRNDPPEFKIKPIFKYPSVEFQGVRVPV